jgi:hypothetical protein
LLFGLSSSALEVFDIHQPDRLTRISRYEENGGFGNLFIRGNRAFFSAAAHVWLYWIFLKLKTSADWVNIRFSRATAFSAWS